MTVTVAVTFGIAACQGTAAGNAKADAASTLEFVATASLRGGSPVSGHAAPGTPGAAAAPPAPVPSAAASAAGSASRGAASVGSSSSAPAGSAPTAAATTAKAGRPGTPLVFTQDTPGSAQVGSAYSGTVTVSGGTAPYTWSGLTNQRFPTGFKASASGATLTLSGTIEESGSFGLAFWVSDSSVPQRTAEVRVPINIPPYYPPLTFSSTVPSTAAVGTRVSAGGGTGGGLQPYTSQLTGQVPPGLALNWLDPGSGSFILIGTPTTPGTYTFSITATDAEKTPQSLSKSYTITVSG